MANFLQKLLKRAGISLFDPAGENERPLPTAAGAARVALAAGLCGFFLGIGAGWQVPVESAQVLAGIVNYPPENPFYMYHVGSWTLLHQAPALLLYLGVPDRCVSLLVGGLVCMVGFQALALCAYAFCGAELPSILVPLVAQASNACRDAEYIYPIRILPHPIWATYGVLGASLTLLVWSLYSLGAKRTAAFLLGLFPALHVLMGSWCLGIWGMSVAWSGRGEIGRLRRLAPWLFAGGAVTAVSLAVHGYLSRGLPEVPVAESTPIVAAYISAWDYHRYAVPLDRVLTPLSCCALALGLLYLRWCPRQLSAQADFLLRALVLTSLFGLLLCISTYARDYLPLAFLSVMPARYLNVVGLAFPAVLLGLLAGRSRGLLFQAVLTWLAVALLFRAGLLKLHWTFYVPQAAKFLLVAGLIALAASADFALLQARERRERIVLGLVYYAALAGLIVAPFNKYTGDKQFQWSLWLPALVLFVFRGRSCRVQSPRLQNWLHAAALLCFASIAAVQAGIAWTGGLSAAWAVWRLAPWCFHTGELPVAARALRWTTGVALAAVFCALAGGAFCRQIVTSHDELPDWHNDAVFAAASRGRGLLLTGSDIGSMQLCTRRPVLLEGRGLNQMPYVPASAPAINRILRVVYGEDIFWPRRDSAAWGGGISPRAGKELWQGRDGAEWLELAREFGVSDVLTYADWRLQLPVTARTDQYTLHHIPGSEPLVDAFLAHVPRR